ncbi:MAG: hypothetical protein E7164_00660 [Firmicutes bacterium]|nr:hypothetical protein [Bacillota bacterium]
METNDNFLSRNLNGNYYQEQIRILEERINNLKQNLPEYDYLPSSKPKNEEDRQRRLISLYKSLEYLKKMANEVERAKVEVYQTEKKLETLAKEKALLELLSSLINERFIKWQIPESSFYEKNYPKYQRIYTKSAKSLNSSSRKIQISAYNYLKRKMKNNIDVQNGIQDANVAVENYYPSLFSHHQGIYLFDYELLQVDKKMIDTIVKKMQSEITPDCIHKNAVDLFNQYLEVKKQLEIGHNLGLSQEMLTNLISEYKLVLENAQEVWYLQSLLAVFQSTIIASSPMFSLLQDFTQKQLSCLNEMIKDTSKLAKTYQIQDKLIAEYQLQSYLGRINIIANQIQNCKSQQNLSAVPFYEAQIEQVKMKMHEILLRFPDLNKPEYNNIVSFGRTSQEDLDDNALMDKYYVEYLESKAKNPQGSPRLFSEYLEMVRYSQSFNAESSIKK